MTPSSALAGITVLEICNVAAGPFCGMLLADMGADVIKVENPEGGDTLRSWPPISDGYSENFASLNRNKRSVTLNLKDPGDLALARELASTADVLIENNRPGVMDRLGLGYDVIAERHPGVIHVSLSGFGVDSPYRDWAAYASIVEAMSGIYAYKTPDGPPTSIPVGALGDIQGSCRRRPAESGRRGARSLRAEIFAPQRAGACAVLRPDPQRQGRRAGRADTVDLARKLHCSRHQR